MDHATPELAVVKIPEYFGPENHLLIDFLPYIVGLKSCDVAKYAEVLEARASSGHTVELRIAHPVHVLLSHVENYIGLSEKRNKETLYRIDHLILLVRRYIQYTAIFSCDPGSDPEEAENAERDARWSMQTLLKQSATPRYAVFTHDTGRDLTLAIPERSQAPVKSQFWDREYPRRCQAVKFRREATTNRRRNTTPDRDA